VGYASVGAYQHGGRRLLIIMTIALHPSPRTLSPRQRSPAGVFVLRRPHPGLLIAAMFLAPRAWGLVKVMQAPANEIDAELWTKEGTPL
jgi:hypothetical protein